MSEATGAGGRTSSKRTAVLAGLVLLVIGLPMLIWGVGQLAQAFASGSWPSVDGRVATVAVRRDSRGSGSGRAYYRYSVKYRYTVDGKAYESDKYALGSGTTAGRAPTHAEAGNEGRKRFPLGKRVTVYYDPDDPATAILEPGAGSASWGVYVPTVLGLLFAGLAVWILVRTRKTPPAG